MAADSCLWTSLIIPQISAEVLTSPSTNCRHNKPLCILIESDLLLRVSSLIKYLRRSVITVFISKQLIKLHFLRQCRLIRILFHHITAPFWLINIHVAIKSRCSREVLLNLFVCSVMTTRPSLPVWLHVDMCISVMTQTGYFFSVLNNISYLFLCRWRLSVIWL